MVSIDPTNHSAFSLDLIIPSPSDRDIGFYLGEPTPEDDEWTPERVTKRWKRKALVLWSYKRYAKVIARLFGHGATAYLDTQDWNNASNDRAIFLEDLIDHLKPDCPSIPSLPLHLRLKLQQKARLNLYETAFEIWPDTDVLFEKIWKIVQNWGLPQTEHELATRIVQSLIGRAPSVRLIVWHVCSYLKSAPTLEEKLKKLSMFVDGHKGIIVIILGWILQHMYKYPIQKDELDIIVEYAGVDFLLENEQ